MSLRSASTSAVGATNVFPVRPDGAIAPTRSYDVTPPLVDMADPTPYASGRRITSASIHGQTVRVHWDGGVNAEFHPLWLRSECACPLCRDRVTMERTFDHFRLPLDLTPAAVEATPEGALRVVWSDDSHISLYDPGWLWTKTELKPPHGPHQTLWEAGFADALPTFDHNTIMTGDLALHAWLVALRDFGLTVVRDIPSVLGQVDRIARRISLPRDTNFGTIFDVVTKLDANSNAYTAIELPGHVDLPTREYQPGLQFFHCLENRAAGGESTYVDGFAVAERLRVEQPECFRLLCEVPIGFRFYDQVSDYHWRAPVIGYDTDGQLSEIRFNPWLTEPLDPAPDTFTPLYRALRRFDELCRDPRHRVQIRLEAGMMTVFDNRRVLHGRAAFDDSGGRRHFQGCYMEREEMISRIRVLERDL